MHLIYMYYNKTKDALNKLFLATDEKKKKKVPKLSKMGGSPNELTRLIPVTLNFPSTHIFLTGDHISTPRVCCEEMQYPSDVFRADGQQCLNCTGFRQITRPIK